MHPQLEKFMLSALIAAAIVAFFYFLMGTSAALTVFTIMAFFMLPTYLILDNFNLEQDEKLVFSFFGGVGVFSSIAYWIGRFISFKIGIFITFAILVLLSFLIKKYKK